MSRTSKREVEAVFERLCATAGIVPLHPINPTYYRDDAGVVCAHRGWSLDHNSAYGGWLVTGHDGHGTGESRPLGDYRMPAAEFVRGMHFAIRVLDAVKQRS